MHAGIHLLAGTMLGMLFVIIGLKLALGTAGIIPSLNIPGGLISFAAIKSITTLGSQLRVSDRSPWLYRLFFLPFTLQENAILQTFILSMGVGGFGSYITGGSSCSPRPATACCIVTHPHDDEGTNASIVQLQLHIVCLSACLMSLVVWTGRHGLPSLPEPRWSPQRNSRLQPRCRV